jgi:multidrug efflux pump subunit AcrA (membrane-fusion protein)
VIAGAGYRWLRPVDVKAAIAQTGPAAEIVYATGTIELDNRIPLRARAGGVVKEVFVREGATVKAGQVLARLENPKVEAHVRKLRSQARVAHSRATRAPRAATTNTRGLRAELEQAQAELEATSKLAEQGSIAPIEAARSRTRVEVLSSRLASTMSGAAGGRVDAKEAAEQAEADLSFAEAQYADLELRAPFDAVVLDAPLKIGDVMAEGQIALMIAKDARVVMLTVDETAMGRVQSRSGSVPGSRAKITVYALDRREISGEVIEVSPEVDRERRTFRAKVRLDGADPDLRSGMTAEANIVVREHTATLVPTESIENGGIWVIQGGKVVRREVGVGIRDLLKTEIISGIHPGDQIVVNASAPLRSGARVRVR